jgi:hypothetical protein
MSETLNLAVGLYGLRTFCYEAGEFHSLSAPAGLWRGGVCEAHCIDFEGTNSAGHLVADKHHGDEPSPVLSCDCGIYASTNYRHLCKQYQTRCNEIIAVIAAEGKTIVGSQGLRTQFARVVGYHFGGWTAMYRLAAHIQFVDATEYDSLSHMLQHFGIPKELDEGPAQAWEVERERARRARLAFLKADPDDRNWWTSN